MYAASGGSMKAAKIMVAAIIFVCSPCSVSICRVLLGPPRKICIGRGTCFCFCVCGGFRIVCICWGSLGFFG